jgi:hypothetical protein
MGSDDVAWGSIMTQVGGDGGIPTIGLAYLLRDTFSGDLAAGNVNGTTADTGQTRTVVDTNSKLTTSGGQAVFATGGAGSGDPGLWYPSVTTVSGMILIINMIPGNSADGGAFGWDSNQSGLIQNALRFASSALQFIVGGTPVSIGAFTISVTYKLILVQRPGGGYWGFAKGGSQYPTIRLVWINTTGAPGALFPSVGNAGNAFNADDIRIPAGVTYIPQPLAYDAFTRSDGALGSTETTGPDSQVLSALAWQFTVGIWTISTNKAIATPVPGADVIVNGGFDADSDWTKGAGWAIAAGVATATASSADLEQTVPPLTVGKWYRVQYTVSGFAAGSVSARVGTTLLPSLGGNGTVVQYDRADATSFMMRGNSGFSGSIDNVSAKELATAELLASVQVSTADVIADVAVTLIGSGTGRPAGLVLNLDSTSNPQNFILCYLDGIGRCVLDECVAGVYTNKILTAITYSAGAVLRVIRDGTSCRVFYNGAAVSTVQAMTANTNLNHGIFSTDAANSLDGFTLWPRGVNSEFAQLDLY